eukprot:CAMPEP_0172663722 /NCGR_PEP_ID=MMETSP1074-20121228/6121_1 /TAXON_ID=2916 /ORGANISM="Ceratium fusus, Strain PA161109" /LENGTH=158 /DNA_ID=CAMNT_0013479761 /DNA_START=46 /DNA_END=522 /DNA_ORIENTATION=-
MWTPIALATFAVYLLSSLLSLTATPGFLFQPLGTHRHFTRQVSRVVLFAQDPKGDAGFDIRPEDQLPLDGEDSFDDDMFDSFIGVPEEVLNEWSEDNIANDILRNFQTAAPEAGQENMLAFRDVYKLLEVLGLDREQFVMMFSDWEGEEEEVDEDKPE